METRDLQGECYQEREHREELEEKLHESNLHLDIVTKDVNELRTKLEAAERELEAIEEALTSRGLVYTTSTGSPSLAQLIGEHFDRAKTRYEGLRTKLEAADMQLKAGQVMVEHMLGKLLPNMCAHGSVSIGLKTVRAIGKLRSDLAAAEAERNDLRAKLEAAESRHREGIQMQNEALERLAHEASDKFDKVRELWLEYNDLRRTPRPAEAIETELDELLQIGGDADDRAIRPAEHNEAGGGRGKGLRCEDCDECGETIDQLWAIVEPFAREADTLTAVVSRMARRLRAVLTAEITPPPKCATCERVREFISKQHRDWQCKAGFTVAGLIHGFYEILAEDSAGAAEITNTAEAEGVGKPAESGRPEYATLQQIEDWVNGVEQMVREEYVTLVTWRHAEISALWGFVNVLRHALGTSRDGDPLEAFGDAVRELVRRVEALGQQSTKTPTG